MILYDKTIEIKGYDAQNAKSYDKVCVKCDECQKEYEKIKRDLLSWDGRCAPCVGRSRGKMMGERFGKTQTLKGKCKNCAAPVRSTIKYCNAAECRNAAKRAMSDRFKGSNNPAWTGKHICECGKKKSFKAINCRSCSFKSGKRSAENNGRFVSNNRAYYLQCLKTRKILSGVMNNVCKSGGITKSKKKTAELLGYSWKEFKEHMESQFTDGFSWETYGPNGWSVDHILPVDWFIKNNVFDVKIVNSIKNLRPLSHKSNMQKSNQISVSDPWLFYKELKKAAYREEDAGTQLS